MDLKATMTSHNNQPPAAMWQGNGMAGQAAMLGSFAQQRHMAAAAAAGMNGFNVLQMQQQAAAQFGQLKSSQTPIAEHLAQSMAAAVAAQHHAAAMAGQQQQQQHAAAMARAAVIMQQQAHHAAQVHFLPVHRVLGDTNRHRCVYT